MQAGPGVWGSGLRASRLTGPRFREGNEKSHLGSTTTKRFNGSRGEKLSKAPPSGCGVKFVYLLRRPLETACEA